MNQVIYKHHTQWHRRLLNCLICRYIVGFLLVVTLPGVLTWGMAGYLSPNVNHVAGFLFEVVTYTGAFFTLRRVLYYPGCRSAGYIIPIVVVWYGVLLMAFFALGLDYSIYYIVYAAMANTLFFFLSYFFVVRRYQTRIALLSLGKATRLDAVKGVEWLELTTPNISGERIDAVAADLHADIPDEWQRFLASCTLAGVPVYHYKPLMESLTGRVRINHLSENEFGSLQPSLFYSALKRTIDIAAVLITAPVTLPVMLLTAIAVKLDSPGSALFIQNRVGQGNRDFKIYKFRSMCKDSEASGAQLAQSNDMRVTRVGKVIRKTRLDEFPQFFNVLLGDMSLIGPRPEQRAFVDQFEEEIPFYIYRHVVKPGITGWAQVEHGYASDADDTRIKLQHDFYYIKNFSLWLDILIVFKTIKTICTGFGAK